MCYAATGRVLYEETIKGLANCELSSLFSESYLLGIESHESDRSVSFGLEFSICSIRNFSESMDGSAVTGVAARGEVTLQVVGEMV